MSWTGRQRGGGGGGETTDGVDGVAISIARKIADVVDGYLLRPDLLLI